jgi:hypothetical protein
MVSGKIDLFLIETEKSQDVVLLLPAAVHSISECGFSGSESISPKPRA